MEFRPARRLQSGPARWEVPYEFPAIAGVIARGLHRLHEAASALQRQMECLDRRSTPSRSPVRPAAALQGQAAHTGPFSVEAVPFPTVLSLDETRTPERPMLPSRAPGDSRSTVADELLRTGIRGKGGQMMKFASLEALPDTRYLPPAAPWPRPGAGGGQLRP